MNDFDALDELPILATRVPRGNSQVGRLGEKTIWHCEVCLALHSFNIHSSCVCHAYLFVFVQEWCTPKKRGFPVENIFLCSWGLRHLCITSFNLIHVYPQTNHDHHNRHDNYLLKLYGYTNENAQDTSSICLLLFPGH